MKKKRFSEEQIIAVLKEAEAGAKVQDLCRKGSPPIDRICGNVVGGPTCRACTPTESVWEENTDGHSGCAWRDPQHGSVCMDYPWKKCVPREGSGGNPQPSPAISTRALAW